MFTREETHFRDLFALVNLVVGENRRTLYGYNEPLLAMTRQFNTWSHHFDFNLTTNAFKEKMLLIFNFGDTGSREMLGE